MKGLCRLALAALFVAACGGDGDITGPNSRDQLMQVPNGGVLSIGVDSTTGASIETNKDDYMPGEVVHVVGRGWAPGDTVNLHMTEEPNTHPDIDTDVIADSTGGFSIHYYDVQEHDFGATFTLTATGRTSGSIAVATFTDGIFQIAILTNPGGLAPSIGYIVRNGCAISTGASSGTYTGTRVPVNAGKVLVFKIPSPAGYAYQPPPTASSGLTVTTIGTDSLCVTGGSPTGPDQNKDVTLNYSVNAIGTTTTLAALPASPTVFGQSVTFTAAVAPTTGSSTPTGTVTFYEFSGTIDCSTASSPLGSDGTAPFTYTTTSLSVATHQIWACYDADAGWTDSKDDISHAVGQANVNVSVSASPASPTNVGVNVTFTATITAVAPGGGTPGGTVSFYDGACGTTQIGSTQTLPANQVSTTTLTAGLHTITACYSGNASFTSGSGSTSHSVALVGTTTAITSQNNPSVTGQPTTYTATVKRTSDNTNATGSVTFKTGGTSCTDAAANVLSGPTALVAGQAQAGPYSYTPAQNGLVVRACFSDGGVTYADSEDYLTQLVNKANTSATATNSPSTSVFGQAVTLGTTVTVVAPGSGLPTGNVKFWELTSGDCTSPVGAQLGTTQALSGVGTASVSYSGFSVGSHTITVCYMGDANFNGTSNTTTQQVNKAQPTLTLTTNGPVYFGNTSTFTATMGVPFSGMPTGTVKFYDGGTCDVNTGDGSGTLLGSGNIGAVLAGKAQFSTTTLNAATYNVVACYGGDGNFLGATDSESHLVNKATTSLSLATSDNDVEFGDPVTFTATVTVTNGVANTNGGIVNFAIGGTCNANGTITGGTALSTASDDLSGGTAAVTVSDLPVGANQTITACYGGNSNIVGSGDTETQTVQKKTTTLVLTVTPATQQYSDKTVLGVTITPAEVNSSQLTGDVYFYVNGASQACGTAAPSGSVGNIAIADADDGVKSFTYTIDKQASTTAYVVTACFYSSNTNFKNSSNTGSLTVNVEEAVVFNETVTPSNIAINGSGQLTFSIKEKNPETNAGTLAAAGDLTKIVHPTNVVVTASGIINPSNQITFTCTRSVGGTALNYSHILNYTCNFGPVLNADTYDVSIDITGNYYDGAGATLIQVTDPSAGFTTGGGWYWHNGIVGGEKVNFGFMAKATVNNKKTNYQGSLLVLRHKANGEIIKVKSNVFEGYSIGTTANNCTPASFSGKATYAVNGVSAGNFAFVGYGVDCGEPGTADKFGLYHAHTPASGYEIATSTTAAGVSGSGSLKTIVGGNIQVPQPSGGRP